MNLNKFIQLWKELMAISKRTLGPKKAKLPIKVTLIPVVKDKNEFIERSNEVKNIVSKMIIAATTRGRPQREEEEMQNAA